MEHMSKEQIGKLVRRVIHSNTGKSTKSMHKVSRLYYRDAEGVYPKNYSGNNLDIDIGGLEHIILDIESELKIDFNIPGEWRDPASYRNTSIKYHKDTRLHHLIDFVHNSYNKAVTQGKAKSSDITSKEINKSPSNDVYVIKTVKLKNVKQGITLYLCRTGDDSSIFAWTSYLSLAALISGETLRQIFDLSADDVIATGIDCVLTNHLKAVTPPFDLSFVRLVEAEGNNWTYTEDDRINQILDNSSLSDEDRALIRSRLK
jgi:hypothetical protein